MRKSGSRHGGGFTIFLDVKNVFHQCFKYTVRGMEEKKKSLDFHHYVKLPVDLRAHIPTSLLQHRLRHKDPHSQPPPQMWEMSSLWLDHRKWSLYVGRLTAVRLQLAFPGSIWLNFLLYLSNGRGLLVQRLHDFLLSRSDCCGLFWNVTSICPPGLNKHLWIWSSSSIPPPSLNLVYIMDWSASPRRRSPGKSYSSIIGIFTGPIFQIIPPP